MRYPIPNMLVFNALIVLALFLPTPSIATKPMVGYSVQGCVIKGQFVPYYGQRFEAVRRLPSWVRKSGARNLEGKTIILGWSGYMSARKEIPSVITPKDSAWWKIAGPCESSRLLKLAQPAG